MVAFRSIVCALAATGAAAIPFDPPSQARSPAATPSPRPRYSDATVHIVGENNTRVYQGYIESIVGEKTVTTASGGSHSCGAPANGLPGGSPAGVLAALAKQRKITWDATWDGSNFDITRIDKYANSGDATWALYVNGDYSTPNQPSCDTQLRYGESTVWLIYNPAQYQHFLYLHHPASSYVNETVPFTVTVTDRLTGAPVQGATIQGASPMGATTDQNGNVTINLEDCGPNNIRARLDGSLDSNYVYLVSDPYGKKKRCV